MSGAERTEAKPESQPAKDGTLGQNPISEPSWLRRQPPPDPGGRPRRHSTGGDRQDPRSASAVDNFVERVGADGTSVRPVLDADPERAAITGRLLEQLGAQLGFRVADTQVRVDAEAARRAGVRGARGLTTDSTIWLHPNSYDPRTPDGRALLAHEATHVAQRGIVAPGRSVHDAEVEADGTAADFAEGRVLTRPSTPLAHGVAAFDTGPTTTLPEATATAPVPTVGEAYAHDIVAIRANLDTGFFDGIDAGEVSTVLLLLDQYDLGTATAIMREVGAPYRERLARHADDGHRRQHRQSMLACYGAMTKDERQRRDADLFDGMELADLPPAEHTTVIEVLRDLSDATFHALLAGDLRARLLTVMQTPVNDKDQKDQHEAVLAALRARVESRAVLDNDKKLRALITSTGQLLTSPDTAKAHQALDALRPLVPAPVPEGGDRAPTARSRSAELAHVVAELEEAGAIRRLIDAVPDDDRAESDHYGTVLLEVIRHRPVAANLAMVQDLLSFGFLDYLPIVGRRRRQPKAWLAYQIVRRLPPADQDRWQRLDNGKWFSRLEDNIPDGQRKQRYEGIVVEQDQQGRFVDVASRIADALTTDAGRDAWTKVEAAYRAAIDETSAPKLLAMIHAVGQDAPESQHPTEIRRAVVLRLDQLRVLDKILSALSDRWLFEIDNLDLLRSVVALREPAQVRRQVYNLFHRHWWHNVPVLGTILRLFPLNLVVSQWSVSARDAFLAFQLARMMSPAFRAELAATGQWSAMVGALTPEMRQAAGMHLFADRDGKERERVLERLRDNRVWQADRAAELRVLVGMAVELGQRRFVFDRSRDTRAFAVTELRPMVDQFGLYAEPGRTTYQPERARGPESRGFFGAIRHAAGWLWSAVGLLRHSARLGRNEVGVADLDLNETQDLAGGELGVAQVARRAEGDTASNRLTLLYNPRDGVLDIDLPELRISAFNLITVGMGIKAKDITLKGLRVLATFPAQRLDQPAAVRLDLSGATLADVLVTEDDLILGIAKIALRRLGLHLSRTGAEDPVPAPPGSDYSLPIPILGPIIAFVVDFLRRLDYVGQAKRARTQLQGLEVSVDDIQLDGVAFGAGKTARSLSVRKVFVGQGLNRSAYLHALREVLQRRLRRASEDQRPGIQQRITETDDALRRIAARDTRLAELQAKYVREPGSLSEADRKEAAALERELSGGAVLDIGELALNGLGGDIELDKAVLTGITGDVTAPVFGPGTSSVFVTDEERIEEFRRRGPQPGVTGTAPLPVRAEQAQLSGIRVVGEIPASEALNDQLVALPRNAPKESRQRLVGLVDRVRAYEALDRRARGLTGPPVTGEDRQTLTVLREELRFAFGVRARTVEVNGIGADLLFGPGLGQVAVGGGGVESFTATDVAAAGKFSASKVTGAGLGGALRPGPGLNASFHVNELKATDAVFDWAGNKAREIGVTGIVGEIEVEKQTPGQPARYRIPNLTVASASVASVNYLTPTAWVHSDGATTVTGISLSAELAQTASGSVITVHQAHIKRLSAERLIVERNGPGTPFRAEVTSGALLNLDVQNVVIEGGADLPTFDRAELGGLDQLKISVALSLLSGPVSGSGVLSSVTETGAARRTGMVVVQSVADSPEGGQQINLNGLRLTGAEVRLPNGRVVIRKLGLGASVHHSGDVWTVGRFAIPELLLGPLRWRTADGAEITSTGGAALNALNAHGTITAPDGVPSRVHVDELRIDSITADHLRYHQDPIDVVVGPRSPSTRPGRPPLEIRDIRLRDLDWTAEHAITSGTLDVGSAGLEFGGQLAEHLKARAGLSLTSVHASFLEGGRLVLRARGSADAGVQWWDQDAPGGPRDMETHVAVNELDTGNVEIGPDTIDFGPRDDPGLEIGDITVDQLIYRSTDLVLGTMYGGKGAVIRRPRAKFRLELRNARERAAAGGASASALRKVVLREFGIEAIELDGLFVELPTLRPPTNLGAPQPVELSLPAGETAFVRDVRLVLPDGGKEIIPPRSPKGGWTIPELNLQIAGGGGLPAVLIPSLRAKAAGVLESASARVDVERIEASLFSAGGVAIDLRRPNITAIEAVLNSFPEHSLRLRGLAVPAGGGVRAERVQLDTRNGEVTISELGASRLKYVNAKAGLEVEVDKASLPRDITATLPGAGRALAGFIPQLNIDGASFRVDFTKGAHTEPDPTFPPEPRPWTALLDKLGTFEKVFDSIQARIALDVHLNALGGHDLRENLTISNGRLNYRQVEDDLGPLKSIVDFQLRGRDSELWLVLHTPSLTHSVPGLTPTVTLAVWRLPHDELIQASRTDQVRLFRLLQIEGLPRDLLLDRASKPSGPHYEPPSTGPGLVELRNIDIDLALRSAAPMAFDLHRATGSKDINGTITLGRNALADLRLVGRLPGGLRQTRYGLAQARVDATDIHFGDMDLGTGAITVTDLSDLAFTLNPDWKPTLLSGRIRRATARNISWRMP
jgi:hypothetical protein